MDGDEDHVVDVDLVVEEEDVEGVDADGYFLVFYVYVFSRSG